ncbi:MAG: TonB-dependent receptor, partial [Prevotellaceae bacterium]|nr:TonB-dependent receptor [Prevotellaceae bacterium]
MKKIFFLSIISFLFVFQSVAQQNLRLSGYVNDKNGQAIAFAFVRTKSGEAGTTTSEKGFFELNVSAADSVYLVFSHLNYKERPYSVAVNGRKQISLSVRLDDLPTNLDGVDVVGIRRREDNMESIDPDRYRRVTDVSGGIESLLTTLPGVSSSNELSSQYSVRGGSFDENMVYVNGTEVYRPLLVTSAQQEGLSFVNPDMVESLQFAAGGFAAEYGDKMASVLDIKYKRPKGFEASVMASLLGGSLYVGQGSEKFSQIHGLRYKTNRYLLNTLDTSGEYNPKFIDYQTYLTYQIAPKWDISFLGNFSRNSYEFVPETRETKFGGMQNAKSFRVYFAGQEQDLFQTIFGALSLNYKPNNRLKMSLQGSAFKTDEEVTYDITGEYFLSELSMGADGKAEEGETLGVGTYMENARNRLNASVIGLRHRGEYSSGDNLLKWGVEWQREDIEDEMSEWKMRNSAGYSVPYDENVLRLFYILKSDQNLSSNRYQSFIQDRYRIRGDFGTVSLTGGVRASYWDFNDELLISPRASANWNPNWAKNLSLYFATGVYYQAPFYKELRDTIQVNGITRVRLNENIKSPRSYHFILGSDYYFRMWERPFKLTSEFYYKYADRLLPYNVDNVQIIYLNDWTAKGYTVGADFKLFGEFVPGTDSWISFSLMRSREDITGDTDAMGNAAGYIPRPNEQRYAVSMYFQDYFPNNDKFKMNLSLTWADGLPFGAPSAERYQAVFRMPPYRRVDIGLSRVLIAAEKEQEARRGIEKWVKSAWIALECFNLLGVNNVSSYYWVTDVHNYQYAVPNYLTERQ